MINWFLISVLFLISCSESPDSGKDNRSFLEIKLTREMSNSKLQISGLDWFGDKLILLTQIPDDFESNVFYLTKKDIITYVNGETALLEPGKIYLDDEGLTALLDENNEYEAILFKDDLVFMVIENDAGEMMESFVVRGRIQESDTIFVDEGSLIKIPIPERSIYEMACESITIINDSLYVFYEANGKNLNSPASCFRLDLQLGEVEKVNMDHIEYRVTDATSADDQNKFWVINNLYKGDLGLLNPAEDNLLPATIGSENNEVKRLIQLQLQEGEIIISNKNTILLDAGNWNWEGLAKLDEMGFLIINDTYAQGRKKTVLGFIPIGN